MSCWKDQDQPAQKKRKCRGGELIVQIDTAVVLHSIHLDIVYIFSCSSCEHFVTQNHATFPQGCFSPSSIYTYTFFIFYLFFLPLTANSRCYCIPLEGNPPSLFKQKKKTALLHTQNSSRWLFFFFFLFCLRCCAFHPIFGFLSPFHPSAVRLEMSSILDVNSCRRRLHDVDWFLFFGRGILIVFLCTTAERQHSLERISESISHVMVNDVRR